MRQRWISRLFKWMTAVILSIALAGAGLPATGIADRGKMTAMAAEIMGIDGDEYSIDEIDRESEIRDNVSNDSVSDAEDAATDLIQEYSDGLMTNEAESSDSSEEALTDQETGSGESETEENTNQLGDDVFCRYEDDGKTLVIYGSGKMWDYGWKYNIRTNKMELVKNPPDFGGITRVVIESGVTTVGAYLFYQNKTLEKAELPDSLTTIGSSAFEYCTSLEEINLPNSLKIIEYSAFYSCTSLEEINLPEGMTSIYDSVFMGCRNLKKVNLPESLTTIGSSAFYSCTSLEEINLPESLKEIESHAFYDCTSLEEIHFPNSLTFIGHKAFFGCPIEKVTIPVLEELSTDVFGGDLSGNRLSFGDHAPHEVVFDNGWKSLYKKRYHKGDSYTGGFIYGSDIDYVILPSTLETIGCDPEKKIFDACDVDLFIFNSIVSRDSRCASYEVPGKRIVFPGTEEDWKATGLSKSKDAKIYYNAQTVEVSLNSRERTVRTLLEIKGEPLSSLPEPVREDPAYAFDGWYLDEGLTQPVVGGETRVEADTTLYAKWRDATGYHAKFFHQNEEGQWGLVEDQVVYEGLSPKEPALNLPEGHRIWEYYEDAAMEQTYDLAKTLQEDVDIYVKSGGLSFFKESVSLKNGKKLSVSLGYRDYADYDARKHVLTVNPANGKVQNPTASLNPDIEVEDFTVALDGKKVKGITLKSCSYKNNINPGDMQLIPTVAYDGKNEELKRLLNENKDLKTKLGKLLKPSYNKTEDEWSSAPILITIFEIQLTEKTPVYNLLGMTKEQKAELAKKDEVLVWNGKQEKITWAKRSEKGEETAWNEDGEPTRWGPSITFFIPMKVEVPNLYYQRVFNLGKDKNGNDKLVTKKIRLRAGGWTTQKVSDDGEIEVIPSKGVCDYYCVEPDWSGYEKGDMPSKIELKVNQDGREYTKMKRVGYREDDGEGHYYTEYSYEEDQEIEYASGFFYGTMPDIVYP